MAQARCANCGETMTLTRLECDSCGWAPMAGSDARAELEQRKQEYREFLGEYLNVKA
jgi:hypothetical protein